MNLINGVTSYLVTNNSNTLLGNVNKPSYSKNQLAVLAYNILFLLKGYTAEEDSTSLHGHNINIHIEYSHYAS